jgi:hypothetical protein
VALLEDLVMPEATKEFPLRVLLSVTTGRLLTEAKGPRDNGIGDLYVLLGWMTNDSPFTHQLPRFADECKPWLLRWFPELTDEATWIDVALYDTPAERIPAAIDAYLIAAQSRGCKPAYDVPRIPVDDHDRKNPFDELVAMRGTDEGIVIVEPQDQT